MRVTNVGVQSSIAFNRPQPAEKQSRQELEGPSNNVTRLGRGLTLFSRGNLRDGNMCYHYAKRLIILGSMALYALACLLVVRTIVPFPLDLDNGYFLPISFYWKNTGILNNPWLNPIGSGTFNWHGFIQPYVVGLLSFGAGWDDIYLGLNLFAATAILAVIVSVVALGIRTLEGACIVLIALSVMLDVRSRPEIIATFAGVVLVTFLGSRRSLSTRSVVSPIVVGLTFGILFCGHPAIFVLLGAAFLAFLIVETAVGNVRFRDMLSFVNWASLVCLLTIALSFAVVYPSPPWVWLDGVSQQSYAHGARSDTQGLFKYFVASRYLPGLGLGFALLAICILTGYQKILQSGKRHNLWLLSYAIAVSISLLLLYRLAVRIPATYYNFSGLLVALALFAATYFCGQGVVIDSVFWRRARASVMTVLVVMAVLCGAAQALWIVQNVEEYGKARTSARLLSTSLQQELRSSKRVCADSAALTVAPDLKSALSIRIFPPWSVEEDQPPQSECEVYVQVQAQRNLTRPRTPPGFVLVSDRFNYDRRFTAVRPMNLAFAIFAAY